MSPEMINEMRYNEKSDIWALGCLLYEMCALVPPFEAQNQLALAVKINAGKFNRIPARYSEDLYRAIRWMLQVDSTKRPAVEELEKIPRVRAFLERPSPPVAGGIPISRATAPAAAAPPPTAEAALARREAECAAREAECARREAECGRREAECGRREREVAAAAAAGGGRGAALPPASTGGGYPAKVLPAVGLQQGNANNNNSIPTVAISLKARPGGYNDTMEADPVAAANSMEGQAAAVWQVPVGV